MKSMLKIQKKLIMYIQEIEKSDLEVVNKHIPLKKRKPVQSPAPFMNNTLRKEIYKKRMLHNNFLKNRSKVNWENYRKQRNHVNKVKKKSIQNYFF